MEARSNPRITMQAQVLRWFGDRSGLAAGIDFHLGYSQAIYNVPTFSRCS